MIEVDIVTPSKKVVAGIKASYLRLPSAKGELKVLPGHTELLTLLTTGVLGFSSDGSERRFAISYGFAEIRQDKALVLAETCEESTEIDRERARAAQKRAEEMLSGTLTQEQFRKYELKLRRAVIRQRITQS